MTKRPNILFLMTDEHRFDISGFMGNNLVRTPNLDKLAKDAVVFDNAYAHNPICVPGRQCMMVGQMSTTCKCERWGEDLKPDSQTFPKILAQHGYETVAAGKLHFMGKDQMQGFTRRIGAESHVTLDYINGLKESYPTATAGKKWTQAKEVARAGIGKSPHEKEDEYALEGLLMFIEEYFVSPTYDRSCKDNPIMLKLSLNHPHYPYLAEEDKFNYYLNRVKPYTNKHMEIGHDFLCAYPPNDSERDMQRTLAAYYSMVENADEKFGKVIAALEKVGENIDDWIVVFTSDHGEMLGEHGVMEKQKFYEGSVRIPLFIRYPKKYAPKRTNKNVSSIDLFLTILEMCGITFNEKIDGRSLCELLNGNSENWQNEVISQFNGTNIMIKRDSLKYHYYTDVKKSYLFNLAKDKNENFNFIDDDEYKDFIDYCNTTKNKLGFI